MNKYLDTSVLTKHTSGNNIGHFDWYANIGKEIPFIYNDISGVIKILDYKSYNGKGRITLQYKNKIQENGTSNLLKLNLPSLFGKQKQSTEYLYNKNDIIDKGIQSSKVIKRIQIPYNNSDARGYRLKCLNCNYEYETREDRVSSCPVCGARASENEKIIFSIFIQAEIKFEVQKEFEWLENKWYDAYLPEYNSIIEIHGAQHFKPVSFPSRERKSAQDQYENYKVLDKIKKDAALKNNYKYYMINASDPENLFSEAKKVLSFIDFTNVSEFECRKFAISNKVQKYFDLWNKGYSLDDISKFTNKSIQAVRNKLRKGSEFNLTNYPKK